ncbi:MAG: hypothetical protein ACI4MI_04335 [Christensenellales bacterium]
MVWLIAIIVVLIVVATVLALLAAGINIKGYIDTDSQRASINTVLFGIFRIKLVIFECKGNLYYQIGKRDFKKITFDKSDEKSQSTPKSKRRQPEKLFPIPLQKLYLNVYYCADDMWSSMVRPFVEFCRSIVEYYLPKYVECEEVCMCINDACVRKGIGVDFNVKTGNGLLSMLFRYASLKIKGGKL